jgi:hypothetical protein
MLFVCAKRLCVIWADHPPCRSQFKTTSFPSGYNYKTRMETAYKIPHEDTRNTYKNLDLDEFKRKYHMEELMTDGHTSFRRLVIYFPGC